MKTVTTGVLRDRLSAGPLALFDVRGDIAYEQGHIPGAKTAPLGSLTFRVASTMNSDSYVVVYDEGQGSGLAAEAAERLGNLGLTNVHSYSLGIAGWTAAGLSTIESPNPKIHTQGPVTECRALIVDRERSYGGAFKDKPSEVEGAGG